jgi:hypothetical protein
VNPAESIGLCAFLIRLKWKYSELTVRGARITNDVLQPKLQRSIDVINSKLGLLRRSAGVLVGVGLLAFSGAALTTEQSKDRQAGRDVKQDAKQEARVEKTACRAADQKSNSECRQDKRETKQEGREDKRETKRQ